MDCYRTVGDLINDKGIIFNYIYDKFGFRVGVVVATKGLGRHHPKIGWALFKEVNHKTILNKRMSDIPAYNTLFHYNAESETVSIPKDIPMIPVESVYLPTMNDKIELFELAYNRSNYDSMYYYISRNDYDAQYDSHLRCDDPSICFENPLTDDVEEIVYNNDYYGIIDAVKKTIKDMDFRAYKYFKK